jgi:AbiV family abortive infection protein
MIKNNALPTLFQNSSMAVLVHKRSVKVILQSMLFMNILNEIYEDGAKAAYKNCLDMLEEANILYSNSKFPRAYALCVLSMEEFAKSFLYKCHSVGLITDKDLKRGIVKHQEKIFHSTHLMLIPYVLHNRYQKFFEAAEHDKNEKDHLKHLAFEAFKRVYEFYKYSDDKEEIVHKYLELFKDVHNLKLKTLYVDIQGNKLVVPNNTITEEKCKQILEFLNTFAYGFDIILGETDEQFKEVVKALDAQIYSQIIKSDFTKIQEFKK